jgi:hypothetical protein
MSMNLPLPDAEPELVLSIVMPCLNEAETLAACIAKARRGLHDQGIAGEVIVADNGSTDGSQEIARRLGVRLVPVESRGYGSAVMGGIAAARGTYVIIGDADDSYDFSSLGGFVEKLQQGYDLVMGSRFKGGIEKGAMPALHRYLGNPVLTAVGRLLFRSPCSDFHCGLRGFRRTSALKMDLRTTGMEFASEMVVKASLHRMRIAEVPTVLSPAGRSRPPHLRTWHDGWRHLRFLLLCSPPWLFLYPGALLSLLGLAAGGAVLRAPVLTTRPMLAMQVSICAVMAVTIGYQAVIFATLAKVFAVLEGLVPPDRRLQTLWRYVRLESGLCAGAVLSCLGLAGMIYALGPGIPEPHAPFSIMRVLLPSITALILGCETVLASLFLSVLGLNRRR